MSDRLSAAEMTKLMLQLSEEEQAAVQAAVRQSAAAYADPKGRELYARSAASALVIFDQLRNLDALGLNAFRIALARYGWAIYSRLIMHERGTMDDEVYGALFELGRIAVPETYAANLIAPVSGEEIRLDRYADLHEEAKALRFTPLRPDQGKHADFRH